MSNPDAEVTLNEYMVACYGTTEYSEDMSNIKLRIDGPEVKTIDYAYKCREEGVVGATEVSAVVPEIETRDAHPASSEIWTLICFTIRKQVFIAAFVASTEERSRTF